MISDRGASEPAQTQSRAIVATGLMRLIDFPAARLGCCLALLASVACGDAVSAVRDGPTDAPTKVEELSDAIAARYSNPERSGRFESSRRRLVGGALHPSRVYSDTSVWRVTASPTRSLLAHGTLTDRGYRFEIADRSPLAKLGDSRHVITLRRLGDGEFQWNTVVDFAIGSVTAADVGRMLTTLLTAGQDRDPLAVRAGAKIAFPRATAVLSRLFVIDSLILRPGPQGTTVVNMVIGVHTETLRKTAPHFADYVAKYVENSRYRFLVADKAGVTFFDVTGANRKISIRYRVRGGMIVSALGPPRPLPDSLRLTSDLAMRVKMFDVGWKNLVTDFTISRSDRSRSWLFVARTEPDWDLPLVSARLIRTPLRRPFQGAGALLEIAVIDSAGGQTNLARRARLEVKESAILRFLSSIVSRIFDDLDEAVEREEAAFIRDLMAAFQQDARAILVR